MIKAVIYARYSSHNQREESIEGQLRKCHDFAKNNNMVVIEEYCDRALSGKTDNRAEFQRLIKDSEKRHFQAVIMYTLDRFARNRYDSAMYKAKLRKNGVKLYYTEQSISDEPEGIILESVLEGMAEYYSENLSRGVKRGMHENALKCLVNGSHMPLGYRKSKDNKYEIDPVTAPVVTEIFDLYLKGKSQRNIVDILHEKGYRTPKGAPFKIGTIAKVLVNKKYIGVYSFGGVVVEDGMPAIIDKDTFNKAQEIMKKNKRFSGRMKNPMHYLLTGKIFCGHCGSAIVGESGTGKSGNIYHYYKCIDRKKGGSCSKKTEKKEYLEKLIVEETIAKIFHPEIIDEISSKVAEIAEREYNDHSRLNSLQSDLKVTQTAIRNILKLVEQGIDTDDVGERLIDLNAQKADLQKQIIQEEKKKPSLTKDKIAYWLTTFMNNGDINDIEYQQKIIDTLVNKVFIFDTDDGGRKIVIFYNTSNNLQSTINLSDLPKSSSINNIGQPKRKVAVRRLFLFVLLSIL